MKRHFPALLLLACAGLLGGTFYLLLADRFETGDVYPPSSSLRSDPLGAMMFFESLQALPGVRAERDESPFNRLPPGHRTAYLQLAADRGDWTSLPPDLFRTIDGFLLEGGRLVVILAPQYGPRDAPPKPEKDARTAKKKKPPAEEDVVSLAEKWGLKISCGPHRPGENLARNKSDLSLPPTLRWHGDLFLEKPDASWRVIYKGGHGPVLAEKTRGAGSIVVATDSFFVSNEALVRDRHPELLAWLVGPADHIVFDETHFGIVDSPGITALARKYRLHGGVAALLVLAGLFIWKNASPLAPRQAAEPSGDVLAGHAAGAGFVSLLRRNIPADRVFDVCLQEWRKAFVHGARFSAREKAAVEEIVREENTRPARERDPVAAYRRIRAALRRPA